MGPLGIKQFRTKFVSVSSSIDRSIYRSISWATKKNTSRLCSTRQLYDIIQSLHCIDQRTHRHDRPYTVHVHIHRRDGTRSSSRIRRLFHLINFCLHNNIRSSGIIRTGVCMFESNLLLIQNARCVHSFLPQSIVYYSMLYLFQIIIHLAF